MMIFSLSGCNLPTVNSTTTPNPGDFVRTSAVQTVAALQTASVSTIIPATPVVTASVPAPIQAATTLLLTQIPCDQASFMLDVTIPDGTKISFGKSFTKTWRLKNTGSCSWNSNYAVVFVDGNSLGAVPAVNLPGPVAPNQEVDISVDMQAPDKPGNYRSNWKLRNASGGIFGSTFYVEFDVMGNEYNFSANVCDAQWSNASTTLTCPGKKDDRTGFVLKLDHPGIETGALTEDDTIETHPQWINDGVIIGKFPGVIVSTGQHFKSQIGCIYQATTCNVKFKVAYQVEGGSIQTLNEWTKAYNGKMITVDENLSTLAGEKVSFVLSVSANGVPTQDWAIWVNPRLSP